jgi:hypothetical protein
MFALLPLIPTKTNLKEWREDRKVIDEKKREARKEVSKQKAEEEQSLIDKRM